MTRERWMALCFALGSVCFFVGPFPGYASSSATPPTPSRSSSGRSCSRSAARCRAGLPGPRGARPPAGARRGGPPSIQSAGHAVLQRHDLSGDAHRRDQLRIRPARMAARLARLDLLPGLGRDRLPRLAAPRHGYRRPAARAGGSRRSTCSAASSSASPPSPATSSPRPARCSTRRRRTGTPRSAPRASWPARSTPCTPTRRPRCRSARLRELGVELEADLRRVGRHPRP